MGASDFLSGGGPRFGARVLADSTLLRRFSEPDAAGRRPQVLQRSRGPTQLSLFSHLEPHGSAIEAFDAEAAVASDAAAAGEPPVDPARTGD